MSSNLGGPVDMRGFSWKLAAFERKLANELDVAMGALATAQREVFVLRQAVERLERESEAQVHAAANAMARGLDPVAHRQALRYLVHVRQRLWDGIREAEAAQPRIAEAARACIEADRKLACVRRARELGEKAYALEQTRRGAKEADLAWLARAGARGSTAAEGSP